MNILIFTQKVDKNDPILGFFHRWVEEFAKHYKKVYVICLEKGEYTLPKNVEVMSLGKENGAGKIVRVINWYRHVTPLLLFGRVDRILVHMNEIYTMMLIPFYVVRKVRRMPLYWWKCHGHLSSLAKISRYFVDRILTCSERSFSAQMKKVLILGHGIDTDHFLPPKEKKSQVNVLAVGRFTKSKRYEDLIHAVSLVQDELTDVPVQIVGAAKEIPEEYEEKLRALVASLGLENIISFVSALPNKKLVSLYQNADILVNTSETDSLDKVVLEAMACGVVPISSNEAYQPILEPFSLSVKKDDARELSRTIVRVIQMKSEDKESLRTQMREIVKQDHNLSNLIRKIYEL